MLLLYVSFILSIFFGLAIGINKYQNSEYKKRLDQKPIKIPEYAKRMINMYLQNKTVLYEEWLTFKNKNKFYTDFYSNVLLKNADFEKLNLKTKNELLLKQWYLTFKSQWSFNALKIFYKQLEIPYHLSVLAEIHKRPVRENFQSEIEIVPILCSQNTEYQEYKKHIITLEPNSLFLEFTILYLKTPTFEIFKQFFNKMPDEKKFWIIPLLYHHDSEEVIEFLQNFYINPKSQYAHELNVQTSKILNKICSRFISPNEKYHAICKNCYRRPNVKKVENNYFLSCELCDSAKNISIGYQEIIAVIGPLRNKNEIEVWNKIDKKIIAAEANSIILRQEEKIDFDWALTYLR